MDTGIQQLKVDQTAVSLNSREAVFITNINIPLRDLDNIRPVLERVYTFLLKDYLGAPLVKYQLTAIYNLIHRQTGSIRHWSGSFLPHEDNLSSIDTFHTLGQNFVDRLEPLCNPVSIFEKLVLKGAETGWQFHSLTGVVINVQALVELEFHTLLLRNLKTVRHGRKRAHITFPLPQGH